MRSSADWVISCACSRTRPRRPVRPSTRRSHPDKREIRVEVGLDPDRVVRSVTPHLEKRYVSEIRPTSRKIEGS